MTTTDHPWETPGTRHAQDAQRARPRLPSFTRPQSASAGRPEYVASFPPLTREDTHDRLALHNAIIDRVTDVRLDATQRENFAHEHRRRWGYKQGVDLMVTPPPARDALEGCAYAVASTARVQESYDYKRVLMRLRTAVSVRELRAVFFVTDVIKDPQDGVCIELLIAASLRDMENERYEHIGLAPGDVVPLPKTDRYLPWRYSGVFRDGPARPAFRPQGGEQAGTANRTDSTANNTARPKIVLYQEW